MWHQVIKFARDAESLLKKTTRESSAEETELSQDEQICKPDEQLKEIESSFQSEVSKTSLNSTLIEIDLSPVKTHAVCSHSIVSYGKKR